jgi:tetratricopeptide (TPR) repeat protein
LLAEETDKDAYYVKGFDSDSFFVTLAQKLGCFPPDFVSKPFSYLDGLFNQLTEYTLPKTDSPIDALKNARSYVQEAIESIEGTSSDVLEASSNLLSGEFEKVVELQPKGTDTLDPKLSDSLAWAYIGQGNEFHDLAITKTGAEAEDLFRQAAEKYEEALKIQPDKYEAHHNLGNTLNGWARLKTGAEADHLFEQASKRYESALNLKPDDVDTYSNWGNNLDAWAWTKTGDEAEKMFKLAAEKYKMALNLNPEHPDSLNGWGVVLFHQALLAADQDADALFELAEKKFKEALEFKPDKFESLDNLGGVLVARSRLKDREQAVKLLETAKSFLLKAEALSRGGGSYNLACISSLLGNEAECHQWLRNAVENGQLISRPEIERDKDFTNVRDKQWFKDFLETLK